MIKSNCKHIFQTPFNDNICTYGSDSFRNVSRTIDEIYNCEKCENFEKTTEEKK